MGKSCSTETERRTDDNDDDDDTVTYTSSPNTPVHTLFRQGSTFLYTQRRGFPAAKHAHHTPPSGAEL
ncbi:hypothetical protein ZHAS_00016458 [Anopheles sinensis]|uniref:Uncharacterized protein n=1 Tax=Anopheles sinensis TaxID=74873 RepID=A0A084WE29_ANOSI|nr:hypothetical protein ZHAS_00016458 [Anopheles sinensis]